jgi:hypothetical protein
VVKVEAELPLPLGPLQLTVIDCCDELAAAGIGMLPEVPETLAFSGLEQLVAIVELQANVEPVPPM